MPFNKPGIIILMFISSSYPYNAPARCEFKFQGSPLSVGDEDLPEYCNLLPAEEKNAWASENDVLDEFYAKLDSAESKLATSSPGDLKNGGKCPDFDRHLRQENKPDFYLRFELYDRLGVSDAFKICNNISAVVEHCNCVNDLRMDMIRWLDDCLMME